MSILSIPEMYTATFPDEEAVARYWWSLPPGSLLPLTNGDVYQVLYSGRPAGSAGPDVRAAVLSNVPPRASLLDQSLRGMIHIRKYCGDVEFHVRASDWVRHRHDTDIRYNNVVLHVVLFWDGSSPTLRQNGLSVPVCSLCDLSPGIIEPLPGDVCQNETLWPCQRILQQASTGRDKLLEDAGVLRFEQKMHHFVEQLHVGAATLSISTLTLYDTCLIPALAEGLGYGRNRDFFRALGLRLSGQRTVLPEPLGRALFPAPLDAGRLHSLRLLIERHHADLWQKLYAIVRPSQACDTVYQVLDALRAFFTEVGLSLARADILVVNVVLPFMAAVALLEQDICLSERALRLYKLHPGLSSNWITRMMSMQLQLPSEPRGSCRQQGLHYIYRETCQEKRCEVCIASRELIL